MVSANLVLKIDAKDVTQTLIRVMSVSMVKYLTQIEGNAYHVKLKQKMMHIEVKWHIAKSALLILFQANQSALNATKSPPRLQDNQMDYIDALVAKMVSLQTK